MSTLNRRTALKTAIAGAGALALGGACSPSTSKATAATNTAVPFRQSVCQWCYGSMPLEAFAERAKDIGLHSIELLTPEQWPIVMRHGLTCAVATHGQASLTDGFNTLANHAKLQPIYTDLINKAAAAGLPNVICFSGNRRDLTDEQGLDNCARGLEALCKQAEKEGITVIMELLNSKLDHKDYHCDRTAWGARLVDKLASPNFKLLYDVYHMQIMEGDIIATIRQYKDYIGHYHTAGVPGRNEIDSTQELNYPAIMRAIADTGFTGFIGQEFIPKKLEPLAALRQGVEICNQI